MKLSLFVALIAVAAASSYDPTINSVVYKPGEQYVYHYKGQVLSGIPLASKQYSGIVIDTLVTLQFRQDFRVVMKLSEIKIFKVNNEITTPAIEPLSHTDVTRLTGEQANVLTQHLVKPLKFKYEEGVVRDIEKESRDRYWSVNIKKGILSLFQITLKEKKSLSDSLSLKSSKEASHSLRSSKDFSPLFPASWNPSKFNSVYKVMESDVTGDCETKYSLIHDKTRMSMSVSTMHVTAVRNFDNCLERPFYVQGIFQGVYVHDAEQDLVQPFVHTDYVITGDRSHFLVKEAVLRGKYLFMPNGLEGIAMSSFIYQSLKLTTTEPISNAVHLVDAKPEVRGLLMVIPRSKVVPETDRHDESDESRDVDVSRRFLKKREQSLYKRDDSRSEEQNDDTDDDDDNKDRSDSLVPVVEEKLTELLRCLYPASDKQCGPILMELSRVTRMLNKEELKPLLMRHIRGNSDTDYRKSEILLDLLPTLSTPDSAKVLLELIQEHHISEFRGALLVKAMSLTVKPTPEIIKRVLDLFKELPKERGTIISPRRVLRRTLLLTVGTLTHRLINVMRSHDKPIPEVISFLDHISSTLKRMLEESSGEPEKVLILKAIANMGASETIPMLKRLIDDRTQSIRVRVNAVFGLRRLAKQLRKQVVPLLMTSFMDIKEEHDVRRAAFVVIIDSNPSFLTLQMIAHLLRNEPSNRIRTLVYSSLINLAQYTSNEPEHKELKKNARLVIKTIPAVPVGVHDTMSLLINKFSEEYDFGASLHLKKYKSKMSGLPEALIASLQTTLLGKHRHLLQAGVEGKALEVILRKIFGPNGLLKEILKGKISMSDLLKPLTKRDMGGLDRKIKEILEKMKLELQKEEEPLAEWYIHVFGHELGYLVLNSENVEDLVHKITSFVPELFAKLARGMKVDLLKTFAHRATLSIASPIGIPLCLNFTSVVIVKVDGHIKIKNLPSWSELYRFPVKIPKMTLEVDLKPTVETSNFFAFGGNMRWIAFGTGYEAHLRTTLPAKLDVTVDGPEHTVAVKYYNPGKSVKVHAKISPMNFFMYVPTTVAKMPFRFEIREIKNEDTIKVNHFEYKYKCELSNVEFEARGQYSICGTRWCPRLFGKQEITLFGHPSSAVEYLFLKIKSLKTNFRSEGVPANHRSSEELYSDNEDVSSEEKPNYKLSSYELVEFDPITPDSIFENEPIKRQISITFGANTRKTPMVKSLITWLSGRRLLKHQVNVQVIRNAHGSLPVWKIKMNKVSNLRALDQWTDSESKYEDTTNEILHKFHFVFKHGNSEAEELKIKITPGSPFDITKELLERGIDTAANLPMARAQKHMFTMEVEFKHMSNIKLLKYISDIKDFVKYQYYDQLTTTIPRSPQPTKLIVAFELLPWWEQMNLVVKTPIENIYIYDVPFYWNPFLPTSQKINLHDVSASSYYRNSSSEEYRDTVPYRSSSAFAAGECLVDFRENTVNTYDGSDISFNSGKSYSDKGCWTLLTQDCSNHCLFTVLSKNNHEGKVIKMLVPKYEIIFNMRSSVVEVMVNNRMMKLTSRQPIELREHESDEQSQVLYEIEKKDSTLIKLKAHELGITLIIDLERETTNIKISPMSMLQGQLCGLCGNYNQDQSDEFLIPDNLKVSSDRPVQLSHFIPSESCDVDNSETTEEFCRKESKHVTISRDEDGTDVTCRSEEKIPQCATGCRPQHVRLVKKCFTCDSENVQSRLRKPYRSPWDREDTTTCADFYQQVEVPARCVPQY